MTDKKIIKYLEDYIAEEELLGANFEDLKPYKQMLLTFQLANLNNKQIEKVREQYTEERGTDADLKTLALFDTVLQQRS